ncbi:hypothetical protein PtB15_9B491 [Puccinia triticina]|nr:hypothetical protein PtB15_9B491 [Puccinia triticina]
MAKNHSTTWVTTLPATQESNQPQLIDSSPCPIPVRQDDDSGTLSDWPPTLGISNLSGAWSQQSPAMGSEPNWLQRQAYSAFRTWVQETTRWVLLAKDLQSYGSQASRRLRVADTPFTWVQAELNRQDEAFRAAV